MTPGNIGKFVLALLLVLFAGICAVYDISGTGATTIYNGLMAVIGFYFRDAMDATKRPFRSRSTVTR